MSTLVIMGLGLISDNLVENVKNIFIKIKMSQHKPQSSAVLHLLKSHPRVLNFATLNQSGVVKPQTQHEGCFFIKLVVFQLLIAAMLVTDV